MRWTWDAARGELSLELARRGFEVTAIDYSQDAVTIAREAISRNLNVFSHISFFCNDVNAADLRGQYGLAIAADLIEHMRPAELDRLYQRTAQHLGPKKDCSSSTPIRIIGTTNTSTPKAETSQADWRLSPNRTTDAVRTTHAHQ